MWQTKFKNIFQIVQQNLVTRNLLHLDTNRQHAPLDIPSKFFFNNCNILSIFGVYKNVVLAIK